MATSCRASFWSRVDTRTYPYVVPLFVFIMFAPCRCISFILQKAPIIYKVIKVREGLRPSRNHTVTTPNPAIPERHKKSGDKLDTKTNKSLCQTSARCRRMTGGHNTSILGLWNRYCFMKVFQINSINEVLGTY